MRELSKFPLLEAALKGDQRIRKVIGISIFLTGIAVGLFLSPKAATSAGFFHIVGVLISIIGGYVFISSLRNRAKHPIIRLLHTQPENICWVYHQIVQSMPFGFSTIRQITIHFHLIDGSSECLRVQERYAHRLLDELKPHLSHTTFGHTLEKEQLFRADPRLLLNLD